MNYKHETLYLNSTRVYLRVGETWYDSRADFGHKIGEQFLIGSIEEILTYSEYTDRFPDAKSELFAKVNDKTGPNGYIRKATYTATSDGGRISSVDYAVNPQQFSVIGNNFDIAD